MAGTLACAAVSRRAMSVSLVNRVNVSRRFGLVKLNKTKTKMSLIDRLVSRGGYGPVLAECINCFSVDLILLISSYAGYPWKLPDEVADQFFAKTNQLRAELDDKTWLFRRICRAYLFVKAGCLVPCGWTVHPNHVGSFVDDAECLQQDYYNRCYLPNKAPTKLWDAVVEERHAVALNRLRETSYGLAIWESINKFSTDICLVVAGYAGYPQPLPDDVRKSFFEKTPFLAPQLDLRHDRCYQRVTLVGEDVKSPPSAKTWQVVWGRLGVHRRDPAWAIAAHQEFMCLHRAWSRNGILKAPERLQYAYAKERAEMKQAQLTSQNETCLIP